MGFGQAVRTCLKKYFVFSGRASRSELWYYMLFQLLIFLSFPLVSVLLDSEILMIVSVVAILGFCFIPSLAVQVRRLHDLGYSGWWYLVTLIPVIGGLAGLALLVMFMFRGTVGENRFGPDPLMDPENGSSDVIGTVFE